MADIPLGDDDEGLDDFTAAHFLGQQVIEMAERAKTADKIVPGAVATYAFEMDGQIYKLELRVERGGD